MDKISVIVPCYNEEKALPLFYEELNKVANKEFNDSEFEIKSIITYDTWQVTFKIPYSVIKKHYKNITSEMRANMYKCGEQTEINHYGCWNEVEVEHEFHAPEYFGKFILE